MEQQTPHQFPMPDWLIRQERALGLPTDPNDFVSIFSAKTGERLYASNPGPQTWALRSWHEELLIGGRRGGGKSSCLLVKPAMGDKSLPKDDAARISFLNDKSYRGLFLREEYQSMSEFMDEGIEFYKHFGGKPSGNPKYIQFDSGARIYFNHLGDEEAFNKYKGWNLTFIGIEELTQIKTLKRYLKLLGSLRSVERSRIIKNEQGQIIQKIFPALRTQICSTTNPDGPGASWVLRRFVEVKNIEGSLIPSNTPMYDPFAKSYRIFIPFPIQANPYLDESKPAGRRYRANLMAQDEVTRKQWMDGDWHAGGGQFFRDYRPHGPVGDEEKRLYPWACHITKPTPFRDWWFRWGSGDWGYDHPAAFHKFIRNENDGRVHIYDELQLRQVGAFELGAVLAKWWQPDLLRLKNGGRDPCIVIYFGKDLFDKLDAEKTRAQQMEAGIKEVLGPSGAILLKYDDTERDISLRDPKRAAAMFAERRKEFMGQICIGLKPIRFERTDAWSYMRDMLRFRPITIFFKDETEKQKYLEDILMTDGREAYELQAQAVRDAKPETLPKLVLWPNCREADRFLREAQVDTSADNDPSKPSRREDVLKQNADSDGKNGDDAGESIRNGIVAFKEIQTEIPKSYFVSEALSQAQVQHVASFGEELTDQTRLAMIAMTQAAKWDNLHVGSGKGFTIPRASSSRHRPPGGRRVN